MLPLRVAPYHVLPNELLELEHDSGARRQGCVPPLRVGILGCLDSIVELPFCCLWQP